ncbi:MAG: hypothetical protein JXR71_01370 [Bacteroidales bacterium]|nr:hypothetical protein [Bacteroidales bacterium]
MKIPLEKINKLGRTKFILYLALFYGVLMSVFSSVVEIIVKDRYSLDQFYSSSAVGMFLGGILGGLFLGMILWSNFQSKKG